MSTLVPDFLSIWALPYVHNLLACFGGKTHTAWCETRTDVFLSACILWLMPLLLFCPAPPPTGSCACGA